jgi:glycosyltransferase involved in cell wall biosynthesis
VLERVRAVPLPLPREIIVVDDGSRDGTREVLQAVHVTDGAVRVIHAPANRGKGAAIRLGLSHARGTIVAIQDADLELDPAQLADLVAPILAGTTDVVFGSRFLAPAGALVPLRTRAANRLLTGLTNLLYGAALTDMETCYKVMRTRIARALVLESDRYDIEPEITAKLLVAGHRIHEVPVRFSPRSSTVRRVCGAVHAQSRRCCERSVWGSAERRPTSPLPWPA